MSKSWRCRLGMHSWYRDCALIHSVGRCNNCNTIDSEKDAALVSRERVLLSNLPADASIADMYMAALGMHRHKLRRVRS